MNDIERRLLHAARELRAVEIEPPALATITTPTSSSGWVARVPALVVPVMFVLGGLAVVVGGMGRTADEPVAAVLDAPATVVAEGAAPVVDTAEARHESALTAHQELALIATLAPARPTSPSDASPAVTDPAPTLVRSYR